MIKPAYIFVFMALIATLAGYVLVFGDVGYLVHRSTQKRFQLLQDEIFALGKKNEQLTDRYYQLKEDADPGTDSAHDASEAAYLDSTDRVTILKFETAPPESTGTADELFFRSNGELDLNRARVLFLFAMFLVTLIGYSILARRTHNDHHPADRRDFAQPGTIRTESGSG